MWAKGNTQSRWKSNFSWWLLASFLSAPDRDAQRVQIGQGWSSGHHNLSTKSNKVFWDDGVSLMKPPSGDQSWLHRAARDVIYSPAIYSCDSLHMRLLTFMFITAVGGTQLIISTAGTGRRRPSTRSSPLLLFCTSHD